MSHHRVRHIALLPEELRAQREYVQNSWCDGIMDRRRLTATTIGSGPMNRAELRQMVEERTKDAKALLDGGRWEFAYYTAGYVVECALKACVLARMVDTGWVFDTKSDLRDCVTHEFHRLLRVAGLTDELNAKLKASAAAGGEFVGHWDKVSGWRVESRYQAKTEAEARALYDAITADPHGVLKWLQNHW